MDQYEEVEVVELNDFVEQVDLCDEKIVNLEVQFVEVQICECDIVLCIKVEMENLCCCIEQDIEKVYKFVFEKFVNELLLVIDSLDCVLEVVDKVNLDMVVMVEGIELMLKFMLDVVCKFGVEVIVEINVLLDLNVYQVIVMVELEEVLVGNVLGIMQKGYMLNGCIICVVMVIVVKVK